MRHVSDAHAVGQRLKRAVPGRPEVLFLSFAPSPDPAKPLVNGTVPQPCAVNHQPICSVVRSRVSVA
jgi:hypothetical protein